MKIATWNVNGIRARHGQLLEWIEHERPDVICLQEIKATIDQLPMGLCDIEGYWCYWHGGKGYSGVALHVRKAAVPERPAFQHPDFDYEHRIVTARLPAVINGAPSAITVASIYVPNGGKDFPAKVRFLDGLVPFEAEEPPDVVAERVHRQARKEKHAMSYRVDDRLLVLIAGLERAAIEPDSNAGRFQRIPDPSDALQILAGGAEEHRVRRVAAGGRHRRGIGWGTRLDLKSGGKLRDERGGAPTG